MIVVDRLSLTAGHFQLTDISLQIAAGEYVVLMGRTGSGKTSLLEALCGLRPVRAGRILIDDVDITRHDPADRQMGYVPQDLALFPGLTVAEHLSFALRLRRIAATEQRRRVTELAELLGITSVLTRSVDRLSGGEAQRVALGRALAIPPRILLLDEPLSALDDVTRQEMYLLLRDLKQKTGVTTLHVTHNQAEARELADRLLILEQGRLTEVATAHDGPKTPPVP
ncbi:ATP-binding cassette domain-containing protein [bacterium]|nr:ATP-binding cassette domain-containing protein [bacterium]